MPTADQKAGPSDAQLFALRRFAARHGRSWKSALRAAWLGDPQHPDAALLRQLRNELGPRWLARYRLPD